MGDNNDDASGTAVLAESSLCTVLRSEDGWVYIQIGYVILRLPERDVASLCGTLQRVVKQLFPKGAEAKAPRPPRPRVKKSPVRATPRAPRRARAAPAGRPELTLIPGGQP